MKKISRSALVSFPAHLMYDLVEDVESYPKFLPWCTGSRILRRSGDVVDAELEISRSGFQKSFATRNTLRAPQEIRMGLLAGPFEHLQGVWSFTPLGPEGSKITLNLEFEMSGKIANVAFGALFNQVCNSMVDAFCERAKLLHTYHHEEDAD